MPSLRDMMRQPGGKMLDTRTRLHAAMPADRKRELERRQLFTMFADALGEEHLFRNQVKHGCKNATTEPSCFRARLKP